MSIKKRQVRRLLDRNGLSTEEAGARIAAQASREARLAAADLVLHNEGSVTQLKDRIADLWDELDLWRARMTYSQCFGLVAAHGPPRRITV